MAGGLRSGRERKAHALPFGGADERLGNNLSFGVCKGLTFEVRSPGSQATVLANAR
jgi:hypothetical protein